MEATFNRVNHAWGVERRALGKKLYEQYVAELPVVENETEAARDERLKAVKTRVADELVEKNTELILQEIRKEFKNKGEAEELIQHLLAVRAIFTVTAQVDAEVQEKIRVYRENLVKNNPIRSRINSWIDKKVSQELARVTEQYQWEVHERALKIFDQNGWKQQAFFLRFFLHKVRDQKFKEAIEKEYVTHLVDVELTRIR